MKKNSLLWFALIVACVSADWCQGQDWRSPAMQQPLRQYYAPNPGLNLFPNRYPLNATDDQQRIDSITVPEAPPPARPLTGPAKMENGAPPQRAAIPAAASAGKSTMTKPLPKENQAAVKRKGKQKLTQRGKKSHPVINYDLFRDDSPFPIDPRKPCSVCQRPASRCQCGEVHLESRWGNQGRPYQAQEPGGYRCGKNCPDKRPMFSVYWPRPFSAKKMSDHSQRCNCERCAKRINDRFDHLVNFKLIDYQRTDSGYGGRGADRFGCLGESKYLNSGM